jgi:hypothetical protein
MMGAMANPLPLGFWNKVRALDNGCWEWTGARSSGGYGSVGLWDGRRVIGKKAHRLAFESFRGAILPGLTIDHLCRFTSCVNPMHLDAVPHRVNILRGQGIAARNLAKTHCVRGHARWRSRLNRRGRYVQRFCIDCHTLRERERRQRAQSRRA